MEKSILIAWFQKQKVSGTLRGYFLFSVLKDRFPSRLQTSNPPARAAYLLSSTTPEMRKDYHRSYVDEPHVGRRKVILEKYPEIETLFGPDPRPIPYAIALVVAQIILSYYQQFWSWPVFLVVAWVFGGTASQALLLMAHELSHNSVFESVRMNDFFGIFCNIGNGFPSATMFKRYHIEHHRFQGMRDNSELNSSSAPPLWLFISNASGDIKYDTDIPTVLEGQIFTNTIFKIIWLTFQSLFYAVRPTLMRPKELRRIDIANILVVMSTNALCVYFFGVRSLVYIIGSSLLGEYASLNNTWSTNSMLTK